MATQVQCKRALELFETDLTQRKNVVGLGIVPSDEQPDSGRRDLAVAVYVKKKVPSKQLSKKDLVPDSLTIPGRKGPVQVPTRVIEQGEVRLENVDKEPV
jgi:hypothetical protein